MEKMKQFTHFLARKKFPGVINCMALGEWDDRKFMVAGVKKVLYIIGQKAKGFEIYQKSECPKWVRSVI